MKRLNNNQRWARTDNLSLPLQRSLSLDSLHHHWRVWDSFQKGMKFTESATKAGCDPECQISSNFSWEREPRWVYLIYHLVQSPLENLLWQGPPHSSGEVAPMNGCSHSNKISLLYQADPSPGATFHPCILHVDPWKKENLHPLSGHSFRLK